MYLLNTLVTFLAGISAIISFICSDELFLLKNVVQANILINFARLLSKIVDTFPLIEKPPT